MENGTEGRVFGEVVRGEWEGGTGSEGELDVWRVGREEGKKGA